MRTHFEDQEGIRIGSYEQDRNISLYSNSRRQFVKKVYSIVMIQLLTTTAFVYLNASSATVRSFQSVYSEFYVFASMVALGTLLILCSLFFI